jgi:ribosomal protein S27AE
MARVDATRKEVQREGLLRAGGDVSVPETVVYRLCSSCNKEYQLDLYRAKDATAHNFGNCPHCGKRNDVWIRVEHNDRTRCSGCGYTQQDAELQLDHHLCSNKNPPWKKYFRSQAVPCDIGTMMYWVEYEDGKNADVDPSKMLEGSIVTDITFESDKREVIKSGNTFVSVHP